MIKRAAVFLTAIIALAACQSPTPMGVPHSTDFAVRVDGVPPERTVAFMTAALERNGAADSDAGGLWVPIDRKPAETTFLIETKEKRSMVSRADRIKMRLVGEPTAEGTLARFSFRVLQSYGTSMENETTLDNAGKWIGEDEALAKFQQQMTGLAALTEQFAMVSNASPDQILRMIESQQR